MSSTRLITIVVLASLSLNALSQSHDLQNALEKLGKQNNAIADSSQNPQLNNMKGEVTLHADSSIVRLERNNRGFKETKGYRIQILIGSIENVKTERNKYLSLGLPYSAYMKQVVPEYSLQIGDFRSKIEVEKHLQIVKEHYPKAFVVIDNIEPARYTFKK